VNVVFEDGSGCDCWYNLAERGNSARWNKSWSDCRKAVSIFVDYQPGLLSLTYGNWNNLLNHWV